jgi:hypothetical protein
MPLILFPLPSPPAKRKHIGRCQQNPCKFFDWGRPRLADARAKEDIFWFPCPKYTGFGRPVHQNVADGDLYSWCKHGKGYVLHDAAQHKEWMARRRHAERAWGRKLPRGRKVGTDPDEKVNCFGWDIDAQE